MTFPRTQDFVFLPTRPTDFSIHKKMPARYFPDGLRLFQLNEAWAGVERATFTILVVSKEGQGAQVGVYKVLDSDLFPFGDHTADLPFKGLFELPGLVDTVERKLLQVTFDPLSVIGDKRVGHAEHLRNFKLRPAVGYQVAVP